MPATSADNSILATGRPVRIPTPDDPSGFPNYYRNFRLTTLDNPCISIAASESTHNSGRTDNTQKDVGGTLVRAVSGSGMRSYGFNAPAIENAPTPYHGHPKL